MEIVELFSGIEGVEVSVACLAVDETQLCPFWFSLQRIVRFPCFWAKISRKRCHAQ